MANINSLFPSKWLKAADLPQGGQTVTIASLSLEEVEEGKEPKPVLHFHGARKGLVMNKTNALMIAHAYGDETDLWREKQIHLYSEPVSFQGKIVDAIRVRAVQPTAPAAAPATAPVVASDDADMDVPW